MSRLSQFSSNNKRTTSQNAEKKNFDQTQIKEKFDLYKNMSKEELNSQLFSEVARQKMQGTFDYNALYNMVESIKSGLSHEQYKNIMGLLESLK